MSKFWHAATADRDNNDDAKTIVIPPVFSEKVKNVQQ